MSRTLLACARQRMGRALLAVLLLAPLLLATLLLASGPARAQLGSLPQRPFFGLDSTAHSGRGGAIALSPDQRRAATVTFDGSLRVWDVASGELQQRFFMPRAADNGSRLSSVDFSPDGQSVVVSGYGMRNTMLVVSLQTGRIERVLRDADETLSLAWSPDGRFVASGKPLHARTRGVRIHAVSSGREVFRDVDLPGEVGSLQFRADGTLMAGSWQSGAYTFKLYKPDGDGFRITARKQPRSGEWRSYWDAAGKTVLAGGANRLDGETLEELGMEIDRRALPNQTGIARLRQSADGKLLFGTSYSRFQGPGIVRRWTGDRRSDTYTDLKIPDARIRDFVLTSRNELVYLDDDGTVGMVGPDLRLAWRVAHDVPALDGRPGDFKVTDAGHVLLPVSAAGGVREMAFNLATGDYRLASAVREPWRAPATTTRAVRVLAWEGTSGGSINDATFPFSGAGERSISVAVHATEPGLVFGTTWGRLYRADAQGRQVWQRYLASNPVAVNIIESRDLVLAMQANGMLRVLRWSTGAPVVSYYLQPASRRWLAISSAGYYEASTGAEDLAGWVVNPTSQRVADFMPLSRLRASLLLPGLAARALQTGSEEEAVRQLVALRPAPASASASASVPAPAPAATPAATPAAAPSAAPPAAPVQSTAPAADAGAPSPPEDAAAVRVDQLPPRIELLSPGYTVSTDQRQLRVRFRAQSPDGAPLTQVRSMVASASVASRSLAGQAQTAAAGDERELVVELPAEDSEVRLIAENRFGASVPAVIRVRYTGQSAQAARGNLYILAAGVSRYDNPQYNLGLAAKDASDFVQTLSRQRGLLYEQVHVKLLQDQAASKAEVEAGFDWLRQNMTARDTAIVFLAGHGLNDGPAYYFLTRDVRLDQLPRTAVPFDRIRATMTSLPGRALIFVDTCHSGNVIGRTTQARDSTVAINDLASSENGLVVFASSTGAQVSQEDPAWGNGAFTKAVVEGLLGAADFNRRGRVTYKSLDAYVSDRVDELTRGSQTPVTPVLQGVPDFVIAQTPPRR